MWRKRILSCRTHIHTHYTNEKAKLRTLRVLSGLYTMWAGVYYKRKTFLYVRWRFWVCVLLSARSSLMTCREFGSNERSRLAVRATNVPGKSHIHHILYTYMLYIHYTIYILHISYTCLCSDWKIFKFSKRKINLTKHTRKPRAVCVLHIMGETFSILLQVVFLKHHKVYKICNACMC